MCSENETVLSDVHINLSCVNCVHTLEKDNCLSSYVDSLPDLQVVKTRFEFPNGEKQLESDCKEVDCSETPVTYLPGNGELGVQEAACDQDGDLIYSSTHRVTKDVIIIDHSLASPLALVGLQVWRGSLLLADFFLHNGKRLLANAKLIELGAGTGFCSLVAAMFAQIVIMTDYDEGVLELCERNFWQNQHLIKAQVKIKMLDWSKDVHSQNAKGVKWRWKPEEENSLNEINMAIAADGMS